MVSSAPPRPGAAARRQSRPAIEGHLPSMEMVSSPASTLDGTGADGPRARGREKNSTRQLPSLCSFPPVVESTARTSTSVGAGLGRRDETSPDLRRVPAT